MNGEWIQLGRAIAQYRQVRGMSLRKLAKRAGVHHSTLTAWEKGEQQPHREKIIALADALGVRRDNWLMLAGFLPEGGVGGEAIAPQGQPLDRVTTALSDGPWDQSVRDAVALLLRATEGWTPQAPESD